MQVALFVVGAYLLGAIPFGLLIGRAHGIDIRQHGSRNIGATNVGRVVGRRWGYLCLALDLLKGFVPTLAAGLVLVDRPLTTSQLWPWLLVGLTAVVGHVFPIYLGFRGGKGVATTVGVALGLFPYYTLAMSAALILYALVRFTTGWVSAGSLTLAVSFPAVVTLYIVTRPDADLGDLWPLVAVAALLGVLIIARHAGNLARLLRGRELKLDSSEGEPAERPLSQR